jgi:IclR family transcriptional regulator, KDG regulon repressor
VKVDQLIAADQRILEFNYYKNISYVKIPSASPTHLEFLLAEKTSGTSSTALKALQVLEIVANYADSISVTEVAEVADVDKSTAYRMLNTLVEAGYVTREDHTKRYRLSYKVVTLSRNLLAENEVSRLIRQTLEQVTSQTQETLHVAMLDGTESVVIQKIKGTQLVNVDFHIGDRSSLHCTSIGKALLAFQDVRYIEEIIALGLPKCASNTITDPDQLRKELQRVRSQGYAFDDHEFSDNMRCVAVPIFENGGHVQMGISISGPDTRFTLEKLEELKDPLLQASQDLSRKLGGFR